MRAADSRDSSYLRPTPLRRRVAALMLALLAQALILLMLLRLAPETFGLPRPDRPLVTIDLLPGGAPAMTREKAVVQPKRAGAAAAAAARAAIIVPVVPRLPPRPLNMVEVSRDVMAAGDISKVPSQPGAPGAENGVATASAGGGAGDSTRAPGSGPGGEKLYNAEWYREPTNAELAFYLKNHNVSGVALIACRTVPNYRVEDCIQLGDEPPGSGLARSMVQAAWQFRVRPPRVGGHQLVGAWVQIRIDWSVKEQAGG